MSDDSFEGWQQLRQNSRRGCPKLFYMFSTLRDGFILRFTDLMTLWECSLDKKGIITQASGQHSTIDPSESSKQYQVFLTKLKQGLQQGKNKLTRDLMATTQVLILRTHIDLPRPLKPLDWSFKLVPQGASELAEQILRPTLQELQMSQKQIESLLRTIREKDHILSKLLDKIGHSAVDLSLLFPGITGVVSRKGHVKVADAMKYVPGMAPFDENNWRQQLDGQDKNGHLLSCGLNSLVSGCEQCFKHTRSEHEDWTSNLPTSNMLEDDTSRSGSQSIGHSTPVNGGEKASTQSEDEFERLATPPSFESKSNESKRKASSPSDSDDISIDERQEPPPKKTKSSKIGTVGHQNQKRRPKSPLIHRSPSPSLVEALSSDSSTETASSITEEQLPNRKKNQTAENPQRKLGKLTKKAQIRSPSPVSLMQVSAPPKHRLGRLGIRKTSDISSPARSSASEATLEQRTKQNNTTKPEIRKLGHLSKPSPPRQASEEEQEEEDDGDLNNANESDEATASPSPSASRHSPRPRHQIQGKAVKEGKGVGPGIEDIRKTVIEKPESPESTANRRREELKRTLNAGGGVDGGSDTAGSTFLQSPKKKKRRF